MLKLRQQITVRESDMQKIDFSEIASKYEELSLVQKSAGDMLIALLEITKDDDVLDIGCGTGYLTKKIREITKGKVVGIDSSEGMITEAQRNFKGCDIIFERKDAQELDYLESFDVIFCNSSFQWFKKPEIILKNCYQALRKNGRIGIQAPAGEVYSPNFIRAIKEIEHDLRTRETFTHFMNPWFFLETTGEYDSLFTKAGFKVLFSKINVVKTSHTSEEVFNIFMSGAVAGYLNQDYYDVIISGDYVKDFQQIIKDAFDKQVNDKGLVELIFNRIYLLAIKE